MKLLSNLTNLGLIVIISLTDISKKKNSLSLRPAPKSLCQLQFLFSSHSLFFSPKWYPDLLSCIELFPELKRKVPSVRDISLKRLYMYSCLHHTFLYSLDGRLLVTSSCYWSCTNFLIFRFSTVFFFLIYVVIVTFVLTLGIIFTLCTFFFTTFFFLHRHFTTFSLWVIQSTSREPHSSYAGKICRNSPNMCL